MHYTQPKILIISQFDENIKKYLKKDYTTVIIKEYKSIEKVLTTHTPQILILDDKYIINSKYSEFKLIKYHPIFNDLPVLSVSENLDDEKNLKLHSLGIRGVLSLEYSEDKVKSILNAILNRSNPNIGSPKDRVIKSFVRYNNMVEEIKEPLYLAEYLLYHYNIDAVNGALVKDAIKLLTVAKYNDSFQNIKNYVHDLAISENLDEIIRNIDEPSTIYDKIIYHSITPQENYVDFKTGNSLDMKNVSLQAKKLNKIPISTSNDIYIFWEKASEIILHYPNIDLSVLDSYLKFIFKILYRALSIRNELIAHLDSSSNEEYIIIQITPKDCTREEIANCIKEIDPSYHLIKLNATIGEQSKPAVDILFTKNPESKQHKDSTNIEKVTETKEPKKNSKIDRERLNTMHYEDYQRVSAIEFAKEFSIDADTIADLDDIEQEATDELYLKDELTQDIVNMVANTLKNYMNILNQTVEFKDIAFAIGSLVSLLESLVLDELSNEKKMEFKAYLTGIIDDMSQWKSHIFIYQNTNDIHYLDASLFENCKTIENIVNSVKAEDEEDDLEFF